MLDNIVARRLEICGECWLWSGCKDGSGYGMISVAGKMLKAHRLMWELVNGPIPRGMLVCHTCDTPACCNPAHLFLGTHRDNMQDKVCKGRPNGGGGWEKIHGAGNGRAKLTQEQVDQIRALREQGMSERDIAGQFGIGKSQAHRIVARENWR